MGVYHIRSRYVDTKSLGHLFSSRMLRTAMSRPTVARPKYAVYCIYFFLPLLIPQIIFVWLLLLRFTALVALEFKRRALLASFLFTRSVVVVYSLFLFPTLLDFLLKPIVCLQKKKVNKICFACCAQATVLFLSVVPVQRPLAFKVLSQTNT